MADLPVVCMLTPEALAARRQNLLAALVNRAVEHQESATGHRFGFLPGEEVLAAVARTVDAERQCCRFVRFQLTVEPDGGPIWLELSGPPGSGEFLSALFED